MLKAEKTRNDSVTGVDLSAHSISESPCRHFSVEWYGDLATSAWHPLDPYVKKSIQYFAIEGKPIGDNDLLATIEKETKDLNPQDLVYLLKSNFNQSLSGWTIDHQIYIATKAGLQELANSKTLKIFEDVHLGQNGCEVLAAVTWKERYESSSSMRVIEDSFVSMRKGLSKSLSDPSSTGGSGWGMQSYSAWLDFVDDKYSERTILKFLVANPLIEEELKRRYLAASNIAKEYYPEGRASREEQRLYCFTSGEPGKIVHGLIKKSLGG